MSEKRKSKQSMIAICPSCNTQSSFQFIGIQEWHPDIARRLNIPPKFSLYRCDTCDSTTNELALAKDSATAG